MKKSDNRRFEEKFQDDESGTVSDCRRNMEFYRESGKRIQTYLARSLLVC